jgi:hypothetical protein
MSGSVAPDKKASLIDALRLAFTGRLRKIILEKHELNFVSSTRRSLGPLRGPRSMRVRPPSSAW